MGMAMGQDPEILGQVCQWINGAATKPVWAKMTPNITDITYVSLLGWLAACDGSVEMLRVRGMRC